MRLDRERSSALLWTALAAAFVAVAAVYMLRRYEVARPKALWTLAAVVLVAVVHVWRMTRRTPEAKLPTLTALAKAPYGLLPRLRHLPFALGLAGVSLLLLAMARPQSRDDWRNEEREGIDIVIALDVSGSMLARDLKPDRLEASKRVAVEFIEDRPNDRIGLVVYEGEAYTQCPITTDHRVLKELFANVRSGLIDGGTAIGMGLATALNRLRESEAKSKVVVLLTDGVNNSGTVQPLDAAHIAETLGIRVYTIGVGTHGKALFPIRLPGGRTHHQYVDVEIDEPLLERIAEMTGGRYFRATNERKLREIYREIDRMEKTRVRVTEHSTRNEEYFPFCAAGAGLLLLGFLIDRSVLRTMA